jgi:CRP/FNR family transcriptional regulator, dissimilatory nitrate respiration regulator
LTRIKPAAAQGAYRDTMPQSRRSSAQGCDLASAWNLSAAQAAALAKHSKALTLSRGELIAQRGTPLPGVFFLSSGTVKLSLRGPDGEERALRVVSAGDCFGEPTALIGKPCLYDAYALTDVKLVVVPTSSIFALIDHDARFARAMVLALSRRSFGILAEFAAATTQRGAQRLAGYLESLARANGTRSSSVHLPVSKTVVAALLGMKKETLSRLLRQFVTDGMIGVSRREIAILDRQRLSAAARQAPH